MNTSILNLKIDIMTLKLKISIASKKLYSFYINIYYKLFKEIIDVIEIRIIVSSRSCIISDEKS